MKKLIFFFFVVCSLSLLAQSDGYLGGPKNDYGNPSAKYGTPSSPPPMKESIRSQPHQNPYFGGSHSGYGQPGHSNRIEHVPPSKGFSR